MSLYTRRGRVDVSTSDSEVDSIASSGDQSPDELVEELARLALAGRYYSGPKVYETNEMLRGHGLARRPRDGPSSTGAPPPQPQSRRVAGPSPPLSPSATETRSRASAFGVSSSPALLSPRGGTLLQRPPRQQQRSRRGGANTIAAAEEDEGGEVRRALERMYRHLAREYASVVPAPPNGSDDVNQGDDSRSGSGPQTTAAADKRNKSPAKKVHREPDDAAFARLVTKGKVQEMRQAEKYHKVKDREEEARKHHKPIRVPKKAVILGRRLHLEEQERRNIAKEMQEELEKNKREEEKKVCTFHPSITPYAERLAADGAYYSLEERLEDQAAHDEERQRLRLERAVELEKECTFKPALSPGTEELVRHQRQRRRKSSSSNRRHSSSSSHRRRHASHHSSHEPFEPSERLYRDGGERLLRQQVRLQRAAARQQRHVVGGRVRLSSEEAQRMVDRFDAWATTREAHREQLRAEMEREVRQNSLPASRAAQHTADRAAGVTRALSRSPSAQSSTTARPRQASSPQATSPSPPPQHALRDETSLVPPNGSYTSSSLAWHQPTPTAPSLSHNAASLPRFSGSLRSASISLSSMDPPTGTHGSSSGAAPMHVVAPIQKEQLRIRLGALFYKFAICPTATTVTLAQVKRQVRTCFPEDSSVAAALASSYDDEAQPLSKPEFMAALARYVAQNGPQPWCMPRTSHYVTSSSPADSLAPSDSGGQHQHGSRAHAGSARAAEVAAHLVSSVHSSESGPRADEAEAVAPLADVPVNASDRAPPKSTTTSVRSSERRARPTNTEPNGSKSTDGPSAAKAADLEWPQTPAAAQLEQPVRTHIYTEAERCAVATPPPPPRRSVSSTPRHHEAHVIQLSPEKQAHVDAADAVPATSSPHRAQAALPESQRRISTGSLSPLKTPAAQLVHGYMGHVERHRRTKHVGGVKATVQEAEKIDECTFKPTLNRRSVSLSAMNKERRNSYARELQLRRRELQLLRESVLHETSGDGVTAATGAVVHTPAVKEERKKPLSQSSRTHHEAITVEREATTPSRRRHSTGADCGASPLAAVGLSLDVSSLSSTSPRVDSAGGMPAAHPAAATAPSPVSEQVPNARETEAEKQLAVAELQHLLARGIVTSTTSSAFAPSPPPSAAQKLACGGDDDASAASASRASTTTTKPTEAAESSTAASAGVAAAKRPPTPSASRFHTASQAKAI